MRDRVNTLPIALTGFLINLVGRWTGRFVDERYFAIGVAAFAVVVYAYFYWVAKTSLNRLIVSALFGYTISSLIKEIVLDPTRIYPAEILSVIPVAYHLYTERKKLKTRQHKNTP